MKQTMTEHFCIYVQRTASIVFIHVKISTVYGIVRVGKDWKAYGTMVRFLENRRDVFEIYEL